MLAAELGYIIDDRRKNWWQRFWDRAAEEKRRQDGRSLTGMLADMVAVGQIVHSAGPPETWALPPGKPPTAAAPASSCAA